MQGAKTLAPAQIPLHKHQRAHCLSWSVLTLLPGLLATQLMALAHIPTPRMSWCVAGKRSAIDRFLRPICYQDVPSYLLPEALADANPQNIPRVVNGDLVWNG